jgi:hypothetical protein
MFVSTLVCRDSPISKAIGYAMDGRGFIPTSKFKRSLGSSKILYALASTYTLNCLLL